MPQSPVTPMMLLIALLSGMSGLGYEIVWTRVAGLALGHDGLAAMAVVAAFFGGLALGAACLTGRILRAPRPLLWLAGLEAAIALASPVIAFVLPTLSGVEAAVLGVDAPQPLVWLTAFALTFLVLLPATFAMGGTLPALSQALARQGTRPLAGLPLAYAANTLGAVLGTLGTTLLLAPALGFTRTALFLAAVNLAVCGMALGRWWAVPVAAPAPPAPEAPGFPGAVFILACTGLLGIGYEIICLRLLAQVFENTVFTFAALLAVYLLGTAAGSALAQPLIHRAGPAAAPRPSRLLALCAASVLAGLFLLPLAPDMLRAARAAAQPLGGMGAAIAGELAAGALVFLAPTLAMGACFGAVASRCGGALPRALALNLAGSALAPAVFGLAVLPLAGPAAAIGLVGAGFAALAVPAARPAARAAVGGLVLAACGLAGPRLDFLDPAAGTLVAQRTGPMATVSVLKSGADSIHLHINSHFRQGGTTAAASDAREAFVPILLHGAPRRALFLGLGTGTTAASARVAPGLAVEGVELLPEILPLLPIFAPAGTLPITADPDVRLHVADARRFVRAARDQWDVIMGELYFPAVDGAGALYTREHFAAARARLAPGGVFCQWLPLHQMDLETLRPILRAFLAVFPAGEAWLAHYGVETPLFGLVGGAPGWRSPRQLPGATTARWRAALADADVADDFDLTGLFVADADGLARFAGPGRMNTDDDPVATWLAPSASYAPRETPAARLLALLRALAPGAESRLGGAPAGPRLAALWQARLAFLEIGARFTAAPLDPLRVLPDALLGVLRISPDFAPAWRPMPALAAAIARRDPDRARALLAAAARLAPGHPELSLR